MICLSRMRGNSHVRLGEEGIDNNPDLSDNNRYSGQVLLSTVKNIKQHNSENYQQCRICLMRRTNLELLLQSEMDDDTPSFSLAEAL